MLQTQSQAYYHTPYGPVGHKEIGHEAVPKAMCTQKQWNKYLQDQADVTESMQIASVKAGVYWL
jgi:hypothetical protein